MEWKKKKMEYQKHKELQIQWSRRLIPQSWKQKIKRRIKWNADDEITLRINALVLGYDNSIYINT